MTDEGEVSAAHLLTVCELSKPPHPSRAAAHLLPRGEKGFVR